ncbi:MAG: HAMP domain-containing sensor histidine kinase [Pseudomonadota bacterium]
MGWAAPLIKPIKSGSASSYPVKGVKQDDDFHIYWRPLIGAMVVTNLILAYGFEDGHFVTKFSLVFMALLIYLVIGLYRRQVVIEQLNVELVESRDSLERKNAELFAMLQALKESEVQLVQSEKMSSLGEMVAGVAHEINTPLAYVKENIEMVDRHIEAFQKNAKFNGELASLLKDSVHGLNQISHLAMNLNNLSRVDRDERIHADLHEGITNAIAIAQSLVKNRAEVFTSFGDIPNIFCSPPHISQVILNLISNAVQAMGDRNGSINISTARHNNQMVRLEIIDNGCGIPLEIQDKIFHPFFTTKEIGKGTGLGLSIVRKIIDAHNGAISVTSLGGEGTRFTILLPIDARSMRE